MIAVDTSALMAIALREPDAAACMDRLSAEQVRISAGTLAEVLIVAARKQVSDQMKQLIEGMSFEVVPVTAASARRAAEAYERWGKGVHPAGLNYGDCFSYELAKSSGCRLLFIGNDFGKTDVASVL